MPIFPWQRTWHTNVWRMVVETCPRGYFCGPLWLSSTILRQIQALRKVSRERAESCLSIAHGTNDEQKYHQWRQLTQFNCPIARRHSPSPFRHSRDLHFPCRREKSMRMYHYIKPTCSQSLTVVERTISDLRA